MKKNKHDHKGTKALKLTLFFTLMLAPLLTIAFKCGYAMFNKNAYQSYTSNYIEQFTKVNNNSMLVENNVYQINYVETSTGNNASFVIKNTNLYDYINTNNRTIDTIRFISESYARIDIVYTNNDTQRINNWNELTTTFTFTLTSTNYTTTNNLPKANLYLITYSEQKLDKTFYYAVNEMQNSELFNWTTNTLMYSPIQAMTNGMGITTPSIAILVCYWLYLTAIYIVIDIVVETFTCITHMITNKLAE